MSKTQKILIGAVIGVVALILGFVLGRSGGADLNTTRSTVKIDEKANIYDPASYAKAYPLQYESYSYAKGKPEGEDKEGEFGGNDLFDHVERQVNLPVLFNNNAFSKDYKDDRGHVWAVKDLYETKRVNETTKGACITCKTPYLEDLYEKYPGNDGWDYAKQPFADIKAMVPEDHGSVSCATCHDPETMDLRIINKSLIEAMDLENAATKPTTQEMRTLVCAQCHVEYYFEPGTTKVVFPWEEGLKPEEMYNYYQKQWDSTESNAFKQDFVNGISSAPILKAQHPDYETWKTGVHGEADVSCADCHMPYMVKNGEKYSNHNVTSPLRTVKESCMTCHDQSEKWLVDQVTSIQGNFWENQRMAEEAVAELHNTIGEAQKAGVDEATLTAARMSARQAQWYWDILAAENSMGFHNVDQGMRVSAEAITIAKDATIKLNKAMK